MLVVEVAAAAVATVVTVEELLFLHICGFVDCLLYIRHLEMWVLQ